MDCIAFPKSIVKTNFEKVALNISSMPDLTLSPRTDILG